MFRIVEPLQQLDTGRLATARGAHQRHLLAGLHLETEVPQYGDCRPGGVPELDPLKAEGAADLRLRGRGGEGTGQYRSGQDRVGLDRSD